MITRTIHCDMDDCEGYLDRVPGYGEIDDLLARMGWTTRRVGDGEVRHVCSECHGRPSTHLRVERDG